MTNKQERSSIEPHNVSTILQPDTSTLRGIRVLEFSAIGPVPWGVSILVDMGATVTRICRPGSQRVGPGSVVEMPDDAISERGRHDVYLDLKDEAGRAQALELIREHDVLIEGMRPGVMERLELSPEACFAVNPSLAFVRVTGWGQEGPLAQRAGHDINYISLTGALHAIGPKDGPPIIPLNLVGDYGGGGAFMIIGVLGALLKAKTTGKGSLVDVAMVDGAARQMGMAYERLGFGEWTDAKGENMLDGGTPWYSVYRTKCGGYMAVGAIEPQFYALLLQGLGLHAGEVPDRDDRSQWEALRSEFATRFLERTRDEWTRIFEPLDACVSPVLGLTEAPNHEHNRARGAFVKSSTGVQPGLAPRFHPANHTE